MPLGRRKTNNTITSSAGASKKGVSQPNIIYYVDPAGSDTNSGTSPSTPWQTLSKVSGATIPAGAWVLFKGGATFSGQLTLTAGQHFGVKGSVTVFGSYGSGKAIIQASTNAHHGVYAINPQYVTIRDLDLRGTGTLVGTGSGIYFENTLTGNVKLLGVSIINNIVSQYGNNGISGWGNPSDVSGSGFDGIVITGNVVHDCTGNATTYQGCGITLQSLNTYGLAAVPPTVINAYVGNNTVYNCIGKSKAIINSHSGNGILLGQAKDSLIAYNYVHHNGGSGGSLVGIWIYDCEAVTLQYNESAFHTVEAGTSDGGGFDLDGGCKDCVVQYNYSHDNVGAGYLLYNYEDGATYGQYPLQGNIIRFNITENDGGASGVSVGKASITIGNDETGRDHTGNKIYNNVIMTSLSGGVAVNFIGAAHNLIKSTYFANNIIRVTGSSGVLIYTYNVTPDTTFKFVGNLYYTTATFSLKWGATTYSSLGTWRAAFVTQETVSGGNTSVSGDPLFVGSVPVGTIGGFNAAALGAYKLQSSSPAKNAGQDLATLYSINLGTIDLFGNPLSAGGVANIGCYEAS